MSKKLELSLGGIWLIASLSALILPVFFPSFPHGPGPQLNVIEVSTLTMFLLSFPSSFFGAPFLFATYRLLDINLNSISGLYTHLSMLFVLGAAQWFWIVPRIWFGGPEIQTLQNALPAFEPVARVDYEAYPSREKTPLEVVIDENRDK